MVNNWHTGRIIQNVKHRNYFELVQYWLEKVKEKDAEVQIKHIQGHSAGTDMLAVGNRVADYLA